MNEVIYPFDDIDQLEIPDQEQDRYGKDFFRNVRELQVGDATNESNPKVFRVDQQGIWLGRRKFLDPNPKFRVSMLGEVVGFSFQTALTGQRVFIQNNQIEFYDSANNFQGQIFGSTLPTTAVILSAINTLLLSGGDHILINGFNYIALYVNGVLFALFDKTSDKIILSKPLGFAQLAADPVTATNGDTYYNTITDELRTYKAGSWRDVITT
jgi:hypothetical protein